MNKFEDYVNILKRNFQNNTNKMLFVCIGTNEVLADSIGPLVGSYLKDRIGANLVLGDCNRNMCRKIDLIYNYSKIKNKFIISIDSAISSPNLMGEVFITKRPIQMGLSRNCNKGKIGNIGIKVAIADLEDINENFINNRVKFVAEGIIRAMELSY